MNSGNKIHISICLLILLCSLNAFSQIPKKALVIVDSILETRVQCVNSNIELIESIFYPREQTNSKDKKNESYYFEYKVSFNEDYSAKLYISINEDFSIKYISDVPDKSYQYSPCTILPKEKLWNIAKTKGLKARLRNAAYNIFLDDDGIYILFDQKRSKWNVDYYVVNATTGEFIKHVQMHICF